MGEDINILWFVFFFGLGMVFLGGLIVTARYHAQIWRIVGRKDILEEVPKVEIPPTVVPELLPTPEMQQNLDNAPGGVFPPFFALKKIQTTTLLGKQYDIVLSFEIMQFLIMLIMQGWDISVSEIEKEIMTTIEENKATFPQGTNTIVVRRIQFNQDHTGTYCIEALSNPSVKSVIT